MKLKEKWTAFRKQRKFNKWSRLSMRLYEKNFSQAGKSKAHSLFCQRVYGKDLCQQGMMDMDQLEKLLDVLQLNENSRVLELGCGNGVITAYISDQTGAAITGVDNCKTAIDYARERFKDKKNKLSFVKEDMQKLSFPDNSFDTIIIIDALHFVLKLEPFINRIKQLVVPKGQMGIFYTQSPENDSLDALQPEKTSLGKTLEKNNLEFKTLNFTEEENGHWKKKIKVLEELKPQFLAENNRFLFNDRYYEAKAIEGKKKKRYRYLYHVNVSK